ncbi:TonB-dependent receptor [Hoylesella oralis]|uniref:TonB-dependent receptor n=1 Tax=Hoylesella oralis TaxID=28134 RepID=UPI0028EFC3A8|nr:TonB-dependent receptor [Hoylesella oralis]
MKRTLLLAVLFAMAFVAVSAQNRQITGTLVDKDTKDAMVQSTVQLLKTDSTFVTGAISDENGKFRITAPEAGKYLLKISSVGYSTTVKQIELAADKDLSLGTIDMKADAVMLKGATVMGQAMKVTVKEDTFIYNASAYRTPEGSVVEELVKRLPGAQIDDNGKITVNGKEVKKILVDGKEFMTGDTQTALKNLPTSIVDRIKAYDEKSDLSKVTGIDDGNEQTVLDFGLKRGMNHGTFSNVDLALGTKNRYAERLMGAYFNSKFRVMLFGGGNNTGDMGFGGRGGGFGRGRNGLNASKMIGTNFNYEEKDKLKIDGSVRWNHSDGDVSTKRSSENFVSTVGSFSNGLNQSYTRGNRWNAQMRLEWQPDSMTDIMFRPTASYSTNDGSGWGMSASYNADPYLYVADPLSVASINRLAADSLMVNLRSNNSVTYSSNKQFGGMLQYNRKFGNIGRNVTLRLDGSYSESNSKSFSASNVHLYQVKDRMGNDSTYQTNRYNLMPVKSWNYSAKATYSEPLWRATFLQFSYQFAYSYRKSDRSTYDFSNLGEQFFAGISPAYRNWDGYLSRLPRPYESYLDTDLSRYSEYKNYTHELEVMFRMIRERFNFNIGVMLQPQKSHFIQNYQGVSVDTTRTVANFTPTLDFRYRFSEVSNLRINYRGTTSQPDMTQLLDITDDSDPLNISKGNPGLKPSFTNTFRFFYNNYTQNHARSMMAHLNFSTTRNSISNKVTYDETTGGRTTQPENINGNWDLNGAFMFNTSVDSAGYWNVNTFTNLGYNNYVGYLSIDRTAGSQKNVTRSLTIGERLAGSFRTAWLEVELDGGLNYVHSRNQLQSSSNLDTWQFSYGLNINLTAPWGTSLATDIHENSRRGYNDRSLNTNELVWNAQFSQAFLRSKALTLSLQFYDILRRQSNLSRTIDAMQRSDTEYNSINSYAMLHVIYRLNIFGGKSGGEHRPDFGPPDGRRGGRRGGPGGFGGGRPPRGGFGGPMM